MSEVSVTCAVVFVPTDEQSPPQLINEEAGLAVRVIAFPSLTNNAEQSAVQLSMPLPGLDATVPVPLPWNFKFSEGA
jgi:hypothetical protein